MKLLPFLFLAATTAPLCAVITVNGLTDETEYDNQVTFTVVSEVGFTTVCLLDGVGIPAGAAYTSRAPGYHELSISKTPTAGGATETALYQYIIQDAAGRNGGGADNGLPTWVPVPQTDAPAAVLNAATALFVMPQRIPQGVALPVIVRLTDGGGQIAKVNGTALTYEPNGASLAHRLYRGAGFGLFPAFTTGGAKSLVVGFNSAGAKETRSVQCVASPAWTTLSGTVSSATLVPANSFLHINGNLTVNAGASLTIGEGTLVRLAAGVDIEVAGTMVVNGTTANPVYFYPAAEGAKWGGIWVRDASGDLDMTGTILTGACEDSNWLSEAPHDFGGHHVNQPVVTFSGLPSTTTVTLTDCYLINNQPGQSFHGDDSNITLTRCLTQRTVSGGQIDGGRVRVVESHFVECGVDNGLFEDDDNDGLYMTRGTNEILRSVFSNCKDDGLDAGSGAGGTILIDGCWIDACWHEAMAWSCDGNPSRIVTVNNTVSINSGQGVEAGFGGSSQGPQVTATGCLFMENATGARFGDNYDWDYPGWLTVRNSTLIGNFRDVWGMEWDSWTYRSDRMTIENNRLSAPNSHHPQNTLFNPATDGTAIAPLISFAAMPRGFGLTGREPQNARDAYGGEVTVHLDRPATAAIALPWRVVVRSGHEAGAAEVVAASGTVNIEAGQSVTQLTLPALSAPHTAWPWAALVVDGQAGVCESTGISALHFTTFHSSAAGTVTLFARGGSWRYYNAGDIGAAAWTTPGYNDSAWLQGNAEFGFGDGDEVTNLTANSVSKKNTYYFRRKFTVADPAAFTSVTLHLQRDDGAVAYLNGAEVWRSNMPAAPTVITYATSASSAQSNADEDTFFQRTWTMAATPNLLLAGENTIAVEVHQISSSTSDISFNAELLAVPVAPPAAAMTATFDGALHILWNGQLRPQQSTDLLFWIPRPDVTSPWRIRIDRPRAFFRVLP
ncbi:MAG: right-handed parallel beta-helix repeat-containing protein [Verrucomicrobiales bacterium]|nr:right-handed parallel beta-helix repeat-containing protein [Verrucomicrobiales bacterium]